MPVRASILAGLCAVFFPIAATAQQIRARVIDAERRSPLENASVVLGDSAGAVITRTTTDEQGFFVLRAPRTGVYGLVIDMPGYSRVEHSLTMARDTALPAFLLTPAAIDLDPIRAEVEAAPAEPGVRNAMQRTYHLMDARRLATMDAQGGTFLTALRQLSAVRIWQYVEPSGRQRTCIESRRRMDRLSRRGRNPGEQDRDGTPICDWIAIIVDGIPIGDPEMSYRSIRLSDYERLEYLSPVDAGFRYGPTAAAVGAIVLRTKH